MICQCQKVSKKIIIRLCNTGNCGNKAGNPKINIVGASEYGHLILYYQNFHK